MTFVNQIWLYLSPIVFVLAMALMLHGLRKREHLLARFAAVRLLGQLTEKAPFGRTLLKGILCVLGLTALTLALSRPQYGVEWSERKARGLDVVFILDSSKSMLATDLRPNRLTRAKLAILDLIDQLESDRIGLVSFAGQAFLQTPPTLDYIAFRESLESVGPSSMSRGGSDLGRALEEAAKAFPAENNYKAVVLLTDGEDLGGNSIATAERLSKEGIKIFAIGIGTTEGVYLKTKTTDGEGVFLRNNQGQPVRSQLDETTLQEIADLTGGQYSRLNDRSIESLYRSVIATLPRSERDSEMQEIPIERYQWPLGAALILLTLEMLVRRRKSNRIAALLCLSILGLSGTPATSRAEASEAVLPLNMSEERSEEITSEVVDPTQIYNAAHNAIIGADYTRAKEQLESAIMASDDLNLQKDALYNLGHNFCRTGEVAFQSGDYETAVEAWKEAAAAFKSSAEIDDKDVEAQQDANLITARHQALEAWLKDQENPKQEQQEGQNQEEETAGEEEDSKGEQQNQESDSGEENKNESGSDTEGSPGNSEQDNDGARSDSSENQPENEESSGHENNETTDPSDQNNPDTGEDHNEASEQDESKTEENSDTEASENDPVSSPADTEQSESTETGTENSGNMTSAIEGMTREEARALLDSLRQNEKLLPFIEAPANEASRRKPIQDW